MSELQPNDIDYERVPLGYECPMCGDDDVSHVVWLEDGTHVCCQTCQQIYDPNDVQE